MSLLVMSLGCLNTTRKPSVRAWNGPLQHLQGQKSKNEQVKNQKHADLFFFDSQGIVYKEFVPQGQTVNQHFYREVLERLRKRVMRVRQNIKNSWVLHHDNAPCHTATSVASKNIPVAPQPPYSPDLGPCDLSPVSEIEESPQRTSFWDTGKHSNGCNRPAEGYSNIRVPPVL
ncbi:putative transposase [Trichonephila clavipes]|nr:putative transposase [Trichonephila clavipes]